MRWLWSRMQHKQNIPPVTWFSSSNRYQENIGFFLEFLEKMRFFLLTALVGLLHVNVVFSLNKRDCKCRIQANRRIIGGERFGLLSRRSFDASVYWLGSNQRVTLRRNFSSCIWIVGRDTAPSSFPWLVTLQWKERDPLPDSLRRLYPDSRKTRFHQWVPSGHQFVWKIHPILIYNRKRFDCYEGKQCLPQGVY